MFADCVAGIHHACYLFLSVPALPSPLLLTQSQTLVLPALAFRAFTAQPFDRPLPRLYETPCQTEPHTPHPISSIQSLPSHLNNPTILPVSPLRSRFSIRQSPDNHAHALHRRPSRFASLSPSPSPSPLLFPLSLSLSSSLSTYTTSPQNPPNKSNHPHQTHPLRTLFHPAQ